MSYIAKNGRLYTSGASEALTLLDDKFSVNKSYSKGDSCIYNDYLWKFTSDKPAGEWDSSVVEQCRIMDFVDDINGRLTQEPYIVANDKPVQAGANQLISSYVIPEDGIYDIISYMNCSLSNSGMYNNGISINSNDYIPASIRTTIVRSTMLDGGGSIAYVVTSLKKGDSVNVVAHTAVACNVRSRLTVARRF